MTDLLARDALELSIQDTIFAGKIHLFPTLESTNTYAMREGANGAPHGSVFIADEQTAGRGRGDHRWHSEPHSGLYISILLRPQVAPADALWLSLAAGLAVRDAVKRATSLEADIRWPNDLLFGMKKFAGILTEMNAEATRVRYAVVGIGINVGHGLFPPELREHATSLRLEANRTPLRQDVLIAVLRAIDAELRAMLQGDISEAAAGILHRMEHASTWVRGKRVVVNETEGYTGVTAGLDARGFLRVETANGIRTVLSGGVRAASAED